MQYPIVDSLDDLELLLLAAKKYYIQPLVDVHKKCFENLMFIQEDPLCLHVIACARGESDDQAKFVARNSELLNVARRFNIGDPKGVSLGSYDNLVSFLAKRDNDHHRTFSKVPSSTNTDYRCRVSLNEAYNKIKENLERPYIQTEQIYPAPINVQPGGEMLGREFENEGVHRTDGDWEGKSVR